MKKKSTEPGGAAPEAAPQDPAGCAPGAPAGRATDPAAGDDAVFRDIIQKAAEGNIKYQELYLKYIDLISRKMVDRDEVIYEASFIDDHDQET